MKPAWELVAYASLLLAPIAAGQSPETAAPMRLLNSPARQGPAFKVVDFDDRFPVYDTTEQPFACIGMIEIRIPNYLFDDGVVTTALVRGTGTLVGPRTVLTAAHVVEPLLEYEGSAAFCPARDGSYEPYGSIRVTGWTFEPGFLPDGDREHDLALLTLASEVEGVAVMPLYAAPDSFYDDGFVLTAGYPGDLDSYHMYEAYGSFLGRVGGRLAIHAVDTYFGQSGAPLLSSDPRTGGMAMVAMHTAGATDNSQAYNWSVRITPARARWIEQRAFADPSADPAPDADAVDDPAEANQTGSVLGADAADSTGMCGSGVGMTLPFLLAAFAGAARPNRTRRSPSRDA